MIDRYERLLDDYEGYLTVELRVSSTTVSDYLREIRQFLAYLHQHETDPLSVDPTGVLQYTAHRADSGLHQRSVGKLITILRSFFHFLAFDELRADDPSSIIELPRVSVTLPDVLTVEEVDTILAAIDTTTHLGIRDRALFELVYSCGLRISEAVQLQIEDLYLDEELIKVTGKGNRERIIPFGAAAGFWLRTYLTAHRVYLLTAGHPTYHLFISRNGTAITRQGAWKQFKKYCLLSGLEAKVHTLRHSYATHLLSNGADLRVVQELLGHADISTTQIYTHISVDDLRKRHASSMPPVLDTNPSD